MINHYYNVHFNQIAKDATPSTDVVPCSQIAEAGSSERSVILLSSPSQSQGSTISVASSGSSRSNLPSYTTSFVIPSKLRPSIMKSLETKVLTPDIKNEVVRDLVTHMYGYMEKPTSSFCTFVAQRLILQYTFMRDSKGTGYVSS